jgi:hypothetical protein
MYLRNEFAPEARMLTSEIFDRSWQFIERDPVLAGEDRQSLQDNLAELILELMGSGERNVVVVANKAIGSLRQKYAKHRRMAA